MAGPFKMRGMSFGNSPMEKDKALGRVKTKKSMSAKGKTREELDKLYNLPHEMLRIVNGKYMHGDKEVSIDDYKRMMKANMLAEAKAKS